MAAESNSLAGLAQLVERGDLIVPPYPAAALKLRRLIEGGDYGMAEVATAAGADPALAATLLRVANSAMYRGTGPAITTLGRAVNRLGARSIATMAVAAAMSAGACAEGALVEVKYRAWRRSLCCALLSQKLAETRSLDTEEAFLTGLLFGFGRSVAIGCLERLIPKQGPVQQRTLLEWLAAVEPYRCELARRVAEQWQLPSEIIAAISPKVGSAPPGGLAALVELADRLAALADRGDSAEQIASDPAVLANERRPVAEFLSALPATLDALMDQPKLGAQKPHASTSVSRPPTNLAGEPRKLAIKLADLKNRKDPRPLDAVSVSSDGICFHSPRPMAESSVARLSLGVNGSSIEGWFSIVTCVSDASRFRVEAQAFAATRELKELLTALWANGQK